MKRPDIDYSKLPEHLVGGFRRYIEDGIEPGQLIQAVIANDLMGAYGRADILSKLAMEDILGFVYNEMPSTSHGSREILAAWIAANSGVQEKPSEDAV
jgi:hypothetical protein